MLVPKRAKHRKQFRGRTRGMSLRGTEVTFGDMGLKVLDPGWLTSRQLEAARKVLTRFTRKGGRIWIRVFPDKPITKKPAETKLGGGKGEPVDYVAVVRPGRMIFEIGGVEEGWAKEALILAGDKLGLRTKIVQKGA